MNTRLAIPLSRAGFHWASPHSLQVIFAMVVKLSP
jgi:hypothetical protein